MNLPVIKQKSEKLPPIPTAMKRGKVALLQQTSGARPALYNSSKAPKPGDEGSPQSYINGKYEHPSRVEYGNPDLASVISSKLYRPINKYTDYSRSVTDEDLLLLMNRELQRTDSQLDRVKQQLISSEEKHAYKDAVISGLNEKVCILEKQLAMETQKKTCPCTVNGLPYEELLIKYNDMEKQLSEMQKFLADYGLTWVGEKISDKNKTEEENVSNVAGVKPNDEAMWSPAKSYPTPPPPQDCSVNFEELLRSIKDLNTIAGEGETQMCYTTSGATFKRTIQSIPLTIYSNGLLFSTQPFRSFSDQATWAILRDILDGYFPHELQRDYPDGVVFQVTDKHDTAYEDPKTKWHAFCGKGHRLGRKTSDTDNSTSKYEKLLR